MSLIQHQANDAQTPYHSAYGASGVFLFLLYLHSLPNGGEIWIMNADGSAQTKMMDAYGFGDGPVWQP